MDELPGDPGAPLGSRSFGELLDKADRLIPKIENHLPVVGKFLARYDITSRAVFLALVGLTLLVILPPLVGWILRRCRRVEPNFRGEQIVQSYGVTILLWAAPMLELYRYLYSARDVAVWLITLVGFGLLGLLDDVFGDKKIKGLRGHFTALLRERRVTTGLVKAVGGLTLALVLGWRIHADRPLTALLAAGLMALGANAINLLDLRPGRAGGVFLLCAVPLVLWTWRREVVSVPFLLFVVLPALIVWQRDAQARVMMGDAGSNLLGAALGLALAQCASIAVQLVALCLLVALHIVAERVSLTKVIAGNSVLRFLDGLTGVR